MEILTNRSKREPDYRIKISNEIILNYVVPRFKNTPKGWKSIPCGFIAPGFKLHYTTQDGEIVVGFEESGYGLPDKWYTKEELIDSCMP